VKTFPETIAGAISILLLAVFMIHPAGASESRESWRPAAGSRSWSFPADHGTHPDFKTEWWYFTGNVTAPGGRELGYQLTFFRTGLATNAAAPENPWSVRDLYLAHLAVTDVKGDRFHWTERASRAGPGLAGAREGRLDVWLRDWKAAWQGSSIVLKARSGEVEIDLTLTPRKPPVLHGEEGLSIKGPGAGQASWYASITDLGTEGTIKIPGEGKKRVSGRSWFDHEFGSNQLAAGQEGWDWFGLHLSDGTELMIFQIRRTDGTLEPSSSGTFVAADGSWEHLPGSEIKIQAAGTWKSRQSGGTYPGAWDIRIPRKGIEVTVTPRIPDQELATEATAGITYWEGAVRLEGRSGKKEITGGGYVELTGYAGGVGGIF
jgi:predicted secreted hydrolase